MIKKFNPEMLILVREYRGLSQTGLAKLLKTSQAEVSKIENGLRNVSGEFLHKLSNILDFLPTFFSEDGESHFGLSYNRKRQALTKKVLSRVTALSNIYRIHIRMLLRSAKLNVNQIPKYDLDEFDNNPQEIARYTRMALGLPKGPIENLTKLLEDSGAFIIHCDFQTRLLDGLTLYIENFPPLIFINSEIPSDRLRFTLSHELGHIVMHRTPNPNMEKQADEFASEFLMPAEDIRYSLGRLNFSKLGSLKLKWKVSMAALIKRASTLKRISSGTERYYNIQLSKKGYRMREPQELDFPKEKPSFLKELINFHLNDLEYSENELNELLGTVPNELKSMYLEQRPTLRLINSN
jgi:Zn-dependent peptidase ImmA (M78 family)/plasmid maintenance system antidote protein VapI